MMRTHFGCIFLFILIATVSLGQKVARYTSTAAITQHEKTEAHFLETVASSGWTLDLKAALNTNNSSYVYVLSRAQCHQEVLVNILGEDASDNMLLAQYLNKNDIQYFLDGEPINSMLTAHAYTARLKYSVEGLLSPDTATPPLFLAVSGPVNDKGCAINVRKKIAKQESVLHSTSS